MSDQPTNVGRVDPRQGRGDVVDIAELRKLEQAAKPNGPLTAELDGDGGWLVKFPPRQKLRGPVQAVLPCYAGEAQIQKLVAAWNALPALLDELEAARRVVEAARSLLWEDRGPSCPRTEAEMHTRDALAAYDSIRSPAKS